VIRIHLDHAGKEYELYFWVDTDELDEKGVADLLFAATRGAQKGAEEFFDRSSHMME
jgi:hypothetical protein